MTTKEQHRFVRDLVRNVTRELLAYEFPPHYGHAELRLLVAARFARTVTRSVRKPHPKPLPDPTPCRAPTEHR